MVRCRTNNISDYFLRKGVTSTSLDRNGGLRENPLPPFGIELVGPRIRQKELLMGLGPAIHGIRTFHLGIRLITPVANFSFAQFLLVNRVLTEPEQVDVLRKRGGSSRRRELDEQRASRASDCLWEPLRELPEAALAGAVAAWKDAWHRVGAIVYLEANRAFRSRRRGRLHFDLY